MYYNSIIIQKGGNRDGKKKLTAVIAACVIALSTSGATLAQEVHPVTVEVLQEAYSRAEQYAEIRREYKPEQWVFIKDGLIIVYIKDEPIPLHMGPRKQS